MMKAEWLKIVSPQNPRIKEVVRLRAKRTRTKTDLILIDGVRELFRACESNIAIEQLFLCKDFLSSDFSQNVAERLSKNAKRTFETSKEVFKKISFGDRQEGLLAIGRRPKWSLHDLTVNKNSFFLVMDNVEKPGNLGAVLRTCDGAGIDGLIVCEGQTDIYHPNVIRASLGTVFSVKVVESSDLEILEFFKENSVTVYATFPGSKTQYTEVSFSFPGAIVLGREHDGLKHFWVEQADVRICIPMRGVGDSLNVSVTAGILAYEAFRQQHKKE